jgi:hypothetical protein
MNFDTKLLKILILKRFDYTIEFNMDKNKNYNQILL